MRVSRNVDAKARYLAALTREIDHVASLLASRRTLSHLHLGGGTPNAYATSQLAELVAHLRGHFTFAPGAELAIEVDPRHLDRAGVHALRDAGFNRISVGVQDLDPAVQAAVRRECGAERIAEVVEASREAGMHSTNVDLIYGLPMQRMETWRATIARVIEMRPGRIALYSFAFVPWIKRHQRAIPASTLPTSEDKLALFCHARAAFIDAGYVAIGMDHFALPGDGLAVADREGRLHRNFQGYTTDGATDLLGFGMSAIGDVDDTYVQNAKDVRAYEASIAAETLPVVRGRRRDRDEEVRRYVIERLMCDHQLSDGELYARFGLRMARAFPEELALLSTSEFAPLCHTSTSHITLTNLGRLFVRVVAMAFDPKVQCTRDADTPLYSRTV